MEHIQAAVLHQFNEPMRTEEISIDEPHDGEALIRVVASGLCHSDYSVLHGILRSELPAVLGHEGAGIVEKVGPGVTHLKPGDHVIAVLTPSCGHCPMCQEESPSLCFETFKTMVGNTMLDGTNRLQLDGRSVRQLCGIGSFAQKAVVPAGALIKVDKDVPLDKVCLIGCGVTTGVGAALNTAQVKPGSSCVVIGCGGVGLSIIQGCRIAGAETIIAVEPNVAKRDLAMELGATHTIDPKAEDARKKVREITMLGTHYAFEAIGRIDTVEQMWGMIRPNGLAVVVGVPNPRDEVKLRVSGFLAQRSMKGSAYGSAVPTRDIPRFVDLYRKGELKLDALITARIGLEQVNEAFEAMGRGEGARSVIVF